MECNEKTGEMIWDKKFHVAAGDWLCGFAQRFRVAFTVH